MREGEKKSDWQVERFACQSLVYFCWSRRMEALGGLVFAFIEGL